VAEAVIAGLQIGSCESPDSTAVAVAVAAVAVVRKSMAVVFLFHNYS
jgi:hypothetical protein